MMGPTWQEQDDLLRTCWLRGDTPQAIAEALGRTEAAVMTRAARLGLPRRAPPGRKPGQKNREGFRAARDGTRMRSGARMARMLQTDPSWNVERVCLMCLHRFASVGPHNRICVPCKSSHEYAAASQLPDIILPD